MVHKRIKVLLVQQDREDQFNDDVEMMLKRKWSKKENNKKKELRWCKWRRTLNRALTDYHNEVQ